MRYRALQRIQNMVAIVCLLALFGIGILLARQGGYLSPSLTDWGTNLRTAFGSLSNVADTNARGQIGIISGHAGSDSGAVCYDDSGAVLLTEADLNRTIVEETADLLRQEWLDVVVLDEFDPRLQRLESTFLLSLHSDSCIGSSGYKAARHPNSPVANKEDQFLLCLEQHYAPVTGLSYHPDTLTHDMFEYHAFTKVAPETPAVILEMGFMGGDQQLLANRSRVVARGIVNSLLCYLDSQEPT